jgi:RimJ/RimL family protein N-acetyltransferase
MIESERLLLRRWRAADIEPFHDMGHDAEVMRYLGAPHSIDECRDIADGQNRLAEGFGRCFWALERKADGAFLGFCGVKPGPAGTPIADTPEIGWRLNRAAWGMGYALEAARAALADEWRRGTPAVFAVTVPANGRSWGLMERLGMTRDLDRDFDHPALPPGDPLRRHILYHIRRPR